MVRYALCTVLILTVVSLVSGTSPGLRVPSTQPGGLILSSADATTDTQTAIILPGQETSLTSQCLLQRELVDNAVERVKTLISKAYPNAETDYRTRRYLSTVSGCTKVTERFFLQRENGRLEDVGASYPLVPKTDDGFTLRIFLSPRITGANFDYESLISEYSEGSGIPSSGRRIQKNWATLTKVHRPKGHPLQLRLEVLYGKRFPQTLLNEIIEVFETSAREWGKPILVTNPVDAYKAWKPSMLESWAHLTFADGTLSLQRFIEERLNRSTKKPRQASLCVRKGDLNNDGFPDYAITDTLDDGNMGMGESDSNWMLFLNDGNGRYYYLDMILLNPDFRITPLAKGKTRLTMQSRYRFSEGTLEFELDSNGARLIRRSLVEHPRESSG